MKRLFILAALVIWAAAFKGGNLIAQEGLMAGNVLGIHLLEYELAPGVTDDQIITFLKEKAMPAYEKYLPGIRALPLSGDRGEDKGRVGYVLVFETIAERDKYAPERDTPSELALAAREKMKPLLDEDLTRLVTSWSTTYTDWEVVATSSKTQGFPVTGNMLGWHVLSHYHLADGVTDEQMETFHREKSIPGWERHFPGVRYTFLVGNRGEHEGRSGILYIVESDGTRNKYWPEDGIGSEFYEEIYEKWTTYFNSSLAEEWNKIFLPLETIHITYTDWMVE